ncbi:MAG: Type pilus assembly protein PilM [Verrucomicrobiota bacterium]
MKKNGAEKALITPDAIGWRLRLGEADQSIATLDEAVALVPSNARIDLALPCQSVLLERHRLPSTDRSELGDMLQLQLEKTLPFPVDEISNGFEVLDTGETESTVLSVTAQHSQLEEICAPLRQNGRVPESISLNALRVAAACPPDETVLATWPEQGQTVIAIFEKGKLGWAQSIAGTTTDEIMAELPAMLIAAELEGAPTNFSRILTAPGNLELVGALGNHFSRQVEPIQDPTDFSSGIDLLPNGWLHEANSRVRGEKLKQRLLAFAVVYLLLVAGAFIFLALQKRRIQKLQIQYAELAPKYDGIKKQSARWDALAPVIDPPRYTAEVLHLLARNRQGITPDVEFTTFNFRPTEWTLKGEATTDSHFSFTQKLKKDEDLQAFNMPPPNPPYVPIGNTGKVTFTIVGRPK